MIHPTRILIVEDRALDAELAEREIRKILPSSVFQRVETREKFLEALETYKPDLVLSDYSLPVFNGMEALNLIHEYSPLTPLIIWTGSVSEETAVQCMKAGAVNYVLKENGKRLPSAIIHALEEKRINLERIANDSKAKEIQRKLEATINAIPDLLFEVGLNGIFYDYHSPRHELLTAPPSEFIGKSIFEVLPPLAAKICNSAIQQAYITGLSNGKQFELKLPIGSRWFEISVSLRKELSGENEPRFIILSRDITNRKEAEEELRRSKEDLAKSNAFNVSVFDSLNEHIVVLDSNGCIIAENAAWKRFAMENGANVSSFIGINYLDVCENAIRESNNPDGIAVNEGILSVLNGTTKEYDLEYPCNSPTEKRWFAMHVTPRFGDEKGVVIAHVDITHRKLLEEQKEHLIRELTQNNNDLLQFSYIISHNLRAPLSNLIGLLSLLDDIEIKDEYIRVIMEGFRTSTHSLNSTLRDLQEIIVIKKQPSINRENINLLEMVENILRQINNSIIDSRPKIVVDCDKVPFIFFNRAYLESILLNLFTNAIRYRDKIRSLEISIRTELEDDKVLFLFTDNGIGIDVIRYKDRLFGFYQKFHNHPESKGFGLFLIKSQIESLGGSIEVNSTVGIGTSFLIKFPRNKDE